MQQLMGGRANNLARFFSFLLSLQKKAFHSCNGECPRSSLREGRIYEGYTARGKEWLQIVFVPGRTRDARENPTLAMPTTKERREPKVVIIVVAKKLRQSLNNHFKYKKEECHISCFFPNCISKTDVICSPALALWRACTCYKAAPFESTKKYLFTLERIPHSHPIRIADNDS